MKKISVKKGNILQRNGDLNTKVYFIEEGLLRSYYIDDKGKEHIFMFAPEKWVMTDNVSPDEPAELFIDAIEDSTIVVREKVFTNPSILPKLVKRVSVLQKRIILLMSATAIERYEHFIETYPQIVQRVPQKMIASYLGITPEALSKVKGEQSKKSNPFWKNLNID